MSPLNSRLPNTDHASNDRETIPAKGKPPAQPSTQERPLNFWFGQLFKINVRVSGEDQMAVFPLTRLSTWTEALTRATTDTATLGDAQGGVSPFPEWQTNDPTVPLLTRVEVADPTNLIANGTLRIDDQTVRIKLTPTEISNIRNGVPTDIRVGFGPAARTLRLAPQEALATETDGIIRVLNLDGFLAHPRIKLADGTITTIKLRPNHVRDLSETLQTKVTLRGRRLTLLATSAEAIASRGPAEADTSTDGVGRAISAPELAIFLPLRQSWHSKGKRRLDELDRLTLIGGEEKSVEIFTWSKHTESLDKTSSVDTDDSWDASDTRHDSLDVYSEITRHNEYTLTANGSLGFSLLGASLTGSISKTTSSKNESVLRSTAESLHDTVVKTSGYLRSSRQSKVAATAESYQETRTIRKLKNPNKCRTLTFTFYDMVTDYLVTTTPVIEKSQLCILIDNPVAQAPFDRKSLRTNATVLRRALLKPELAGGLEAAIFLEARENYTALARDLVGAPSDVVEFSWLEASLSEILLSTEQLWPVSPMLATAQTELIRKEMLGAGEVPANPTVAEMALFRRWSYATLLQYVAPELVNSLRRYHAKKRLTNALSPSEQWRAARELFEEISFSGGIDALRPERIQRENIDRLKGAILDEMNITFHQNDLALRDKIWAFLSYYGVLEVLDDVGLVIALRTFTADWQWSNTTLGQSSKERSESERKVKALVADTYDPRSVAAAMEREEALLSHLNSFADYYRFALFSALSPDQRQALVSKNVMFNDRVVNPTALAYTGSKIALPIAVEQLPGESDGAWRDQFFGKLDVEALTSTNTVALPGGVDMEATLGTEELCEPHIVEMRRWKAAQRRATALEKTYAAKAQGARARRHWMRLESQPPLLNDPECCAHPYLVTGCTCVSKCLGTQEQPPASSDV